MRLRGLTDSLDYLMFILHRAHTRSSISPSARYIIVNNVSVVHGHIYSDALQIYRNCQKGIFMHTY